MRSMLTATLIFVAAAAAAEAQTKPSSAAGTKPKPVATVPIRPALQTPADTANAMAQARTAGDPVGPGLGRPVQRRHHRRGQRAHGGRHQGNSRRSEAASRPACSIRRSAACWPTPRSGGRTMSAGKSSPIPAPACGSACRPSWCRSNPATPTAPNGVRRPAPSRSCWRGARKPTRPPRNSPIGKGRSRPGASIDYTVVKPDFFVLSGMQGLKKFYVRGTVQGRRGSHPHHPVRSGHRKHRRAGGDRDVERVQSVSDPARRWRGRRRARPSNMAPAWSSATTARSSPTARSPMAAWPSRSPASATPIASPRTRSTISRCCASTARAD